MRVEIAAILGLAAGAAGTYAVLWRAPPSKTVVVEVPASNSMIEAPSAGLRSAEDRVAVPSRAPVEPTGTGVFALDLKAWAELDGMKAEKDENLKHVWHTIGRVYARAGRVADFLRLADAELAAGGTNSVGILWLVTEFPSAQRLSTMEALLRSHPTYESRVPRVTLGQAYLLCGAREKGFALVVDGLRTAKGEYLAAVVSLVGADADRADSALWALAGDWSQQALSNVATQLANHGRQDLAKRWLDLIARRVGPGLSPAEIAAQTADAVRNAEAATRESPNESSTWHNLAQARIEAGDPKGAFDAYVRALEVGGLDPGFLESMEGLDAPRALPFLERAARDDGDDDVLHLLAIGYLKAGRGREAAETYFRIRHPEGEELLAREFASLAPEAAIPALERRLRRRGASEESGTLETYGTALIASGQSARGFEQFRRAVEAGGPGRCCEGLARADAARAIPLLESIVRDQPGNNEARIALADAYRRVGRREDAVAWCDAYIASRPEWHPEALLVLALIDPEKGLPRLRAACEDHPTRVDGWVELGDVYRELGKPADAKAAYERAIAAGESDPYLLARIASLR